MHLGNGASYQIIKEGLTQEDARNLKTQLIEIYKATVINKRLPKENLSIDADYLRQFYEISTESPTGMLLKSSATNFKAVGKPCGYIRRPNGKSYWSVSKDNVEYFVHRLICTMLYGDLADDLVVNHIDGNGLNNKVENLEVVTLRINSLECKDSKNSTTDHNGVIIHKDKNGNVDGAVARYPTEAHVAGSKFFALSRYGTIDACVAEASTFHKVKKKVLITKLRQDMEERLTKQQRK